VEYVAGISLRKLSINVAVRVPFRVDIEFMADRASERFGNGSDEGSIRIYHGSCMFGINMENKADSRLSKAAISFNQPIIGNYCSYPGLGRIKYNEYNTLTWIVGEKHFAVVINGEVRYCGANFPYMGADLHLQRPETIVIGSDGQGKKYFRSVKVSQLKITPKTKIKKGELNVSVNQSNNMIPIIHPLVNFGLGENYLFNGCAKYVMECLGETDFDYEFFAGFTGDNFTQVYSFDRFRGDGVTDYLLSDPNRPNYVEEIFAECGYASTFVNIKQLAGNPSMYVQTLRSYIDSGLPVIFNHWGKNPNMVYVWGVFVGYEDYGKTLLYITADLQEPERIALADLFSDDIRDDQVHCKGWVFIGEKRKTVSIAELYRKRITTLPQLLTVKTENYCFGAEAFRAWAADIENGKNDGIKPEDFDPWSMYTVYVCNLATNSCCCQSFLKRALQLHPDLKFIEDVHQLYDQTHRLWKKQKGEDLEAIGGAFNITLAALQNPEQRSRIAAKLREFTEVYDQIAAVLSANQQ